MQNNANSLVILDFETSGLSPDSGDRAIEIGAVRITDGQVTGHFQELMDPGFRINTFIENYTGITNKMLKAAPPCADVMARFAEFIGDDNLVAHNASFDKRFLEAEFEQISTQYLGSFACSLLVARRLYPHAPDHKLGTLVRYKNISAAGSFHRALFDAQMTAKLWLAMLDDICLQANITKVPFSLIQTLSKTPKNQIAKLLAKYSINECV